MTIPTGAASYKKKDGVLTLTPDQKRVTWTPNTAPGGPPSVSLPISEITNLQQTPDSAAKVMLKIFHKPAGASEPATYLFHFNSPADPRAEANVIRDLLSKRMLEAKDNDPSVPRPNAASSGSSRGGVSGSMAFANAVNSKLARERLFDDEALKNDIALQQSLLRADRNLSQMYMEGRRMKPETMSDTTFNAQFWSARVNLLRAHAIENNQKKGPYNVLAQVKPTMENADPSKPNELKIKFSVEQIQMILNQHPLVKRIYNENVPPVKQNDFWERFFLSKLSKQLRGERITELEKPDTLFDKYDEYDDIKDFKSKLLSKHVPHIIDVEGNEENQGGQKGGNRKDVEMRPRGRKEVPIIQTLNSISEKLLASTTSRDNGPSIPVEKENDTYRELALRDLRGDVEESRIILNIKEQNNFFSSDAGVISETAAVYEKQKPSKVVKDVQGDLKGLNQYSAGGVDLHASLGIDDDSESDGEGQKPDHVGSRASRKTAQKQIIDSMAQRRAQLFGHDSEETSPMGLTPDLTQTCNLTHATTIEFVKQFWSAFLSGDPDRALELGYLAEALKRSKDRINAVAEEAEKVREQQIKKRKEEIYQVYERTKKKIKFNSKNVRGGREAVLTLMEPTIESLDKAIAEYQKALAAEGIQASTE
ncbi:hypothetical protein F4806DRAFT_448430 [Annulohypoxylon nitens]|nr:hypothetical protein F4806DRAFT_448430 [Annulohypoxylon nitens]